MPTATAQSVEDFKQYARLRRSNAEVQHHICLFLAKLVQATKPETVKQICDDELAWFLAHYSGASARTTYMSAYRKAIQACFAERKIPDALLVQRQTSKGLITQHLALNLMMAPAEDYEVRRQQNKTKTDTDQDNSTPFDMDAALAATESALHSKDWREVVAGLLMASQTRPSDILQLAEFKALSKYRLHIQTTLKKRGSKVTAEIWCLTDTMLFIDALNRVRRDPNVLTLKDARPAEIDSRKNSTINRAVNRVYGTIIAPPFTETELSAHNLRAAGTNIGYHLYGSEGQKLQRFVELQLVHDSKGTAANYDDYYCINAQGREVTTKGLREDAPLKIQPKSRITKRPTLDQQIIDDLETLFGTGSTKENVIEAIALAKQTIKLKAENERLSARLKAAEERIEVLEEYSSRELIHLYPEGTKPRRSPVEDIRSTPNADLISSKKRGAFEERLRRSVEAIQEYNAGRPLEEQIAINAGSLRKIAKGNVQAINMWVKNNDELEAYSAAQGHTYRQNVGKDLSVIKWNEDAYGAYEWPESYFS
ncbi:protelomerase family protein [Sphaerothrix gracilis]|uniref:protelomerase family protein n=1 Tax=Sphaerothrix gracilis TaxID=3151835 RepID=UPI0031FBB2D6